MTTVFHKVDMGRLLDGDEHPEVRRQRRVERLESLPQNSASGADVAGAKTDRVSEAGVDVDVSVDVSYRQRPTPGCEKE